jgi:hypothetical protein
MSTTFGIKYGDEVIPVARRYSIGDGKVGITFTNEVAKLLPSDTPVEPIDNTAQGVRTIGDLIFLEHYGTFKGQI